MAGQHVPVRRHGLGMAPLARPGQRNADPARVTVPDAPLDAAVPGQTVYQTGQRALAQMDGLGQVLGAELAPVALGQPLQYLEVTDPEPVLFAELTLQGGAGGGV